MIPQSYPLYVVPEVSMGAGKSACAPGLVVGWRLSDGGGELFPYFVPLGLAWAPVVALDREHHDLAYYRTFEEAEAAYAARSRLQP